MTASVSIREAREADRPVLNAFMQGLNVFEHTLRPDRDTGPAAAESHMTYLLDCVSDQGGFALIADIDGRPAGFLLALIEQAAGTYLIPEQRQYGVITDLFVAEDARRKGVAQALIREAEDRFRATGIDRVMVTALSDNRDAVETYGALGYGPSETTFVKPL